MNADNENTIKICLKGLDFQQTLVEKRNIHHEIAGEPREVISGDIFLIYNKQCLCIFDVIGNSQSSR